MHPFEQIFDHIRGAENYRERCQLIQYLHQVTEKRRHTLDESDCRALAEFALKEAAGLPAIIEATEDIAARDDVCTYAGFLPEFVMLAYPQASDMPADDYASMLALHDVLARERFLENAVDEAFEEGIPSAADIDRLLCVVAPLKEEYRKGKFYVGILHYRDQVLRMAPDAKDKLAAYTASELRRYLALDDLDKLVMDALEMIADVCGLFMTDELAELLSDVLARGHHAVQYYAVATLLKAGKRVPDAVVAGLAQDLEYADLTYAALRSAGKTDLFPAELATPEYLAKSDLVHWLTYPTELGQVPDEIEYLGAVKKGLIKGETYHVFRFKSVSDTLSEDRKGRWLLGWSNDEGGTFSNFDIYDEYDGGTVGKTLKNIKRKLL